MIFPTAAAFPRPIRLPESVRAWAWESLHGKYGDEAVSHGFVTMDDIPGFASLSPLEKQDLAITRIAETAPLRICTEELVCGAATLGQSICHVIPACFHGKPLQSSVSHLTIRFDRMLKEGLVSYEEEIALRLRAPALTEKQTAFLRSLQNVIEAIRIWHGRYLALTKDTRPDLHRLLTRVPFQPARSFHEAVQCLWFIFAFTRLCGNWPGIGRIDWLLGNYLRQDLESGAVTLEDARKILASLFIKGCEWIQSDTPAGSGDAQHYQNIVLAGIDSAGNEVTNEVTYLVLDIVEELSISDFPITVRLNRNTPPALKRRIAEVMRHGGGIVAVYNEELILRSFALQGYAPEEARMFANDGCWEVQIPGRTNFLYMCIDSLQTLCRAIGIGGETVPNFASAEEVYAAFHRELKKDVDAFYDTYIRREYSCADGVWQADKAYPASVVSLFEDGCIPNARAYTDLGPVYFLRSAHIGGAPDAANSLLAIQKLVFDEKKVTLPELIGILQRNWEGHEELRQYIRNACVYYGNDSNEADLWHSRILNDFAALVTARDAAENCPVRFIPGISTFGRQIDWLPFRCATPFGAKQGEILSGNDSPTPGTDTQGATAVIKSHCKADLEKQFSGAALDIKLYPASLNGEQGIAALVGLMDGFLQLGGFFLQLDTVDVNTLLEARKNPQQYKTLSVRVSGWNARFVTLNEKWQDMVIQRTAQNPG